MPLNNINVIYICACLIMLVVNVQIIYILLGQPKLRSNLMEIGVDYS